LLIPPRELRDTYVILPAVVAEKFADPNKGIERDRQLIHSS